STTGIGTPSRTFALPQVRHADSRMSAMPLDPVWHPDCASLGGIRRILPPSTQRPSERKMSILFLLRPALGGWVSTGDLRFLRLAAACPVLAMPVAPLCDCAQASWVGLVSMHVALSWQRP